MALTDKLTAIADAIRAKTGGTSALTLDGMAEAVAGIEAGGGGGSFPNGTEWTQSNVTTGTFVAAANANGIWVAGSASQGIYYSTDGMNWTQSNVSSNRADQIGNANGIWVAGSYNAYAHYSTDGMAWTKSSTSIKPQQLVYGDVGLWVAENGSNEYIYYSTDGMAWTKSSTQGGGGAFCYAHGLFVKGDSTPLYSTDGIQWANGSKNISSTYVFLSVSNANGIWVGAAGLGGLWYSTDGMNWTQSNVTSGGFGSLAYGNGIWVAAGKGCVAYSVDGMTWVEVSIKKSDASTCTVEYANGIFVYGGYGIGYWYSTDGMNWTQSNVTSGTTYPVKNANGIWVMCCNSGLWYSKTWEPSN